MALSTPFAGTGEFVPEREWSCPVHERHVSDYEECDPWTHEGEICLDCETGRWRDVRDAGGNVVMREVGEMESFLVRDVAAEMNKWRSQLATILLADRLPSGPPIQWMEDER